LNLRRNKKSQQTRATGLLKRFGLVQYGKQTAERSECWQAWRKK